MIYSITGVIEYIEQNHVVIECGGIGYSVRTSMTSLSKLGGVGDKVKMYTYLHIREDAMELFGFTGTNELNIFKMLISVSGVGPKAAISILSDLSPEKFIMCVASSDAKTLTKSQGIGLKTAQRIVLELKDKISKDQIAEGVVGNAMSDISLKTGNASEAINALEVLGYSRSDATQVITKLDGNMSVEEMIKSGLKALAGKV